MTLSKRGFLGGLVGGAAVGPEMARSAMNSTLKSGADVSNFGLVGGYGQGIPERSIPHHEVIRNAYEAGLISKEAIYEALFSGEGDPKYFDTDSEFVQNKSFSHVTKLRLSRDKTKEKRFEHFLSGQSERGWMSGVFDLISKIK